MNQHFVASGLVFNNDRLLLLEHPKINRWIYPGGHLEVGETPDQCLKREVFEETGYVVEIVNNNHSFSYADHRAQTLHLPFCILKELIEEETPHYHVDFVFLCKLKTRDMKNRGEKKYGWFTLDETKNLSTLENFYALIIEAFKFYNSNSVLFAE